MMAGRRAGDFDQPLLPGFGFVHVIIFLLRVRRAAVGESALHHR